MRRLSAEILFGIVVISVAVMWVTAKWATSIPEVGGFTLAALWMVLFLLRRETPRFSPVIIPLFCVILWAGFQLLIGATVFREQTWLAILYWAGNFAVFFVSLQLYIDTAIRKQFLRWLLVFGFVVSVVSSLQALTTNTKIYWIFPTEFAGRNLLGPFVNHNQFAAFIELLLPIALYNALTEVKWRVFDILIAAIMYASVIVSTSRTGIILVTAELILVPAVVLRKRSVAPRQVKWGGALLGGMVIVLAISAGPEVIAGRFAVKDPYAGRREFLYSSLEMVKDKPFLGVGLGNWATAYPGYALYDDGSYANQAHNDWAQWAVEGGAPLLLLLLWVAFWAIPRALRSAWGAGVAAIFLHCFVDYPIQRPAVALVFFALLGAIAAQQKESLDSEPVQSPRRIRSGFAQTGFDE